MRAEFTRLTEKDASDLFKEGLKKYTNGILDCTTRSPTKQIICSAIGKAKTAASRRRKFLLLNLLTGFSFDSLPKCSAYKDDFMFFYIA